MKIILIENVAGVGKKWTEAEVKSGYAKNKLFPTGVAIPYNAKNAVWLQQQQASILSEKELVQANAREAVEKLNGVTLVFTGKMTKGKLYGSISTKDIVAKVKKEHQVTLLESNLDLNKANLKEEGTYQIKANFTDDLNVSFSLEIKGE